MRGEENAQRRSREAERAWAAGFFDGEGSWINSKHSYGYWGILMSIHNTDTDLLEKFQDTMGGIGLTRYHGTVPNHKPMWCYRIHKFEDVREAIILLWPYLGTAKKTQYKKCIDRRIESRIKHFGWHKP